MSTFRVALTIEELECINLMAATAVINANRASDSSLVEQAIVSKLKVLLFKAREGIRAPDYVSTGPRAPKYSAEKLGLIEEFDETALLAELSNIDTNNQNK